MKSLKYITEGFFNTSGSGLDTTKQKVFDRCKEIISQTSNIEDRHIIVNDDLTVSIKSRKHIELCIKDKELGVKFKNVGGPITLNMCKKLETLRGLPKSVPGGLFIYNCPKLKSLEGSPSTITKHSTQRYNTLQMRGCSELESLVGCPLQVQVVQLMASPKLESLEGLQINKILHNIYIVNCGIKNLNGLPKEIELGTTVMGCENLVSLDSTCKRSGSLDIIHCSQITPEMEAAVTWVEK